MIVSVVDNTRVLALAVRMAGGAGLYWGWEAGGPSAPFDPAAHLRALSPCEPPPSPFSALVAAAVPDSLSGSGGELVLFALAPDGTPAALLDVETL